MPTASRLPAALIGALAGAACIGALAQAPAVPNAVRPMEAVAVPDVPSTINFATSDGWRTSRLVGLILYDRDGAKVGDVRDILIDRTGQVRTVLVGVGGLLGVGEREILLPFDNVAWSVPARDPAGSEVTGRFIAQAVPVQGVVDLPRAQIDAAPTAAR